MTDLDVLMEMDPLQLTDQHIDEIIDYQRKVRAQRETGGPKPKRGASDAPRVKLDLASLGLVKPKAPVAKVRRV